MVLLITAFLNFFTKEVATGGGLIFTGVLLLVFIFSERAHEKRLRGAQHAHLDHFNRQTVDEVTPASLGLKRPYRKLVAIRSPQNLFMLEKALAETDPETTDVVVMTAKLLPTGEAFGGRTELDPYDQQLMTAVVERAEKAGKRVKPIILPTNNPLHTVLRVAMDTGAQELVMGASNKYTADEQLEQLGLYWFNLHPGEPRPLTVRILSRHRDVYLDLAGGSRIPKITDRQARSVAELRAAGVGVDRVLLVHDGTQAGSDLFQSVLTMLDPQVGLDLVLVGQGSAPGQPNGTLDRDRALAEKLGRELESHTIHADPGPEVVRLAQQGDYDLVILAMQGGQQAAAWQEFMQYLLRNAPCPVFLAAQPAIPQQVDDQ
jgi:nucleotide-binding universal stress UspA family protein